MSRIAYLRCSKCGKVEEHDWETVRDNEEMRKEIGIKPTSFLCAECDPDFLIEDEEY